MKTTLILILSLICFTLGCDEYNPVGLAGNGGENDTTFVINPPEPEDTVYVALDVDLAVSPSQNDDHEIVVVGITGGRTVDAYIYVERRLPPENDMTFWIGDQPYAIPDPMFRPADGWVHFTGVKISDTVPLGLTIDKGPANKKDSGSGHKNANRITRVVFSTIGLRE